MAGALDGRRVIVTGGSSGLGAALVGAFVAEGARVVAMSRNRSAGESIVAAANERGPGCAAYVRCDVSEKASVNGAFGQAVGILGGLDALAHAAGVELHAPAESIRLEDWELVFATNARGTFLTNQAAFAHLRERGGRIVNFASGAGVTGMPGGAHYSAAKGAVLAWTRTAAQEWGRFGITVNALAPAIWTPMYDGHRARMTPPQLAAHEADIAGRMPIDGKLGDPERDFVPVLVFLVGEGSGFITGQTIAVDGGMCMVR